MTKFRTIIYQISMLVITLMNYEWYLQEEVPYYMCEVVLLRILHPLHSEYLPEQYNYDKLHCSPVNLCEVLLW